MSSSTRHFVRHYVEMVVAMFLGMVVLGVPAGWALGAAESQYELAAPVQRAGTERAAQPREHGSEKLARLGRRVGRPQQLDQLVATDRAVLVPSQKGDNHRRLAAAEGDLAATHFQRERAAQRIRADDSVPYGWRRTIGSPRRDAFAELSGLQAST